MNYFACWKSTKMVKLSCLTLCHQVSGDDVRHPPSEPLPVEDWSCLQSITPSRYLPVAEQHPAIDTIDVEVGGKERFLTVKWWSSSSGRGAPRIEFQETIPHYNFDDVVLETFRAFGSPEVTDVSLRLAPPLARLEHYNRSSGDTCIEAELVRCFPSVARLDARVGSLFSLDGLFKALAPRSSDGAPVCPAPALEHLMIQWQSPPPPRVGSERRRSRSGRRCRGEPRWATGCGRWNAIVNLPGHQGPQT